MKKSVIFLLLVTSCRFYSYGQDINKDTIETEVIPFYHLPTVLPHKERDFCRKTRVFFSEPRLVNKLKFDVFNNHFFSLLIETDSMGKFRPVQHKLYPFLRTENIIEKKFIEKVLKYFTWDVSMMRLKDFHDENNKFEIYLDITVNRKRKIIRIGTTARGKYDTQRTILCRQ